MLSVFMWKGHKAKRQTHGEWKHETRISAERRAIHLIELHDLGISGYEETTDRAGNICIVLDASKWYDA